jgi:hypothetical protein
METLLLFGFALGLRHATDADHIVAVTGLLDGAATRSPGAAARIGALWGLGHMAAILAAGGAVVALRVAIPAWLEWILELAVALVLMGLGARILLQCFRGRFHFHAHWHGRWPHVHLHHHGPDAPPHDHAQHLPRMPHGRAPLLIGAVHGLAGSAALALLVLATIPSRAQGAFYLLAFGAGALAGMAAFSALLSWPLGRFVRREVWLRGIRFAAGTANAGLGVFLVCRAFLHAWPV